MRPEIDQRVADNESSIVRRVMKRNFARCGAIDGDYVNGGANRVAIADFGKSNFGFTQALAVSEKWS